MQPLAAQTGATADEIWDFIGYEILFFHNFKFHNSPMAGTGRMMRSQAGDLGGFAIATDRAAGRVREVRDQLIS